MLLLKLRQIDDKESTGEIFTFHYASIKTDDENIFKVDKRHLHFTMLLLKHCPICGTKDAKEIYISLCFY